MSAFQSRTRLVRFCVETWSGTRIDDLRRVFVAHDQHVGQALDHVSVKRGIKFPFRQRDVTLLKR